MFRPKPPEERPGTFRPPTGPLPVPAEKLRPKTYEEIRARVLEEMRNQEEKKAR